MYRVTQWRMYQYLVCDGNPSCIIQSKLNMKHWTVMDFHQRKHQWKQSHEIKLIQSQLLNTKYASNARLEYKWWISINSKISTRYHQRITARINNGIIYVLSQKNSVFKVVCVLQLSIWASQCIIMTSFWFYKLIQYNCSWWISIRMIAK